MSHPTDTMDCTNPDCHRQTSMFLCRQCVSDLQAWIDQIPDLMVDLFITMGKLDKTAPQRHEGGGGLSTGSAMPIRIEPMELRAALHLWIHQDAAELAKDKYAGNFQPMLSDLVKRAHSIIDNPPEIRAIATCECGGMVTTTDPRPEPTMIDPDPIDRGKCQECGTVFEKTQASTHARIMASTPANLKTRQALKWIRENSGLSINPTDIRNWARERKLIPTNPARGKDEHPTYNVADILTVHYRHVGKNKRATSF